MGVVMGFRWVLGEVSWVVDGCGRGSQVRLEWVTVTMVEVLWVCLPSVVVAGSG